MPIKNKIIVTGGAGYIGSHTIIELIERTDYEIISIDNFSNASPKTFQRIEHITGRKITNYNIDACDKVALFKCLDQLEHVAGIIHFAAFKSVPESVSNPNKYYHNNINSLLNIVEGCLKFNIENFIFSSSCSVYGNIASLPVTEETPFSIAESPYAGTKQIGESILKDYAKAFPNLKSIALRYFNPVGAHISGLNGEFPIHAPSNLVPVITQTAIGKIKQMTVFGTDYPTRDGSCVRDYIHVSDLANAHVIALEKLIQNNQTANFSIYNLGTGQGVSVLEAIEAFERTSGIKLNYKLEDRRSGDVSAIYSDTSKSDTELGWKPTFTLDQMMGTAWKWEQNLKEEN
jgi:UDP-glucose 4-epimerase